MAKSLNIWYVASPGGPLPSLFKSCPCCRKWSHPWGHMFYIGSYEVYGEQHEKILLSENVRPRVLNL